MAAATWPDLNGDQMNCPACNATMTSGELALDADWIDLLTDASSAPDLVFVPSGESPLRIMALADRPAAYRCSSCHTVVIEGILGTESECLACRAVMALGVKVCKVCGWTYEGEPS